MGKPMKPAIPILRSFDETKAREFYVTFLGFKIDWEHRFAEGMPLYMQISRGDCVLHLSEHHGDCAPGARVRIETPDLDAYLDGLRAANYKYSKPGKAELQPWGLREIDLADPFGNHLTLYAAA
ncbi:bleomycin resistance protein [Brevifollis gellanilyticus]|uniref:Bleomycin resistance protein n=2 Tax=Brevifollis gellanilyticus TaxID=748831 RepID=A0A512MH88_9BACT|nr:bleomycin resistance protein [Brevifollis gellanilyticus]